MSGSPEEILGPHGWTDKLTYVPAVRVGEMVHISGTTATDAQHQLVAPGDIVGQTRRIFEKFEDLLQSLGASCKDIVATTDYYVTAENYPGTAAVRREFLGSRRPISTGVQVAGLLRPGALIEISAIAHVPPKPAPRPAASAVQRQLYAIIRFDRPDAPADLRARLEAEHRQYVASLAPAVKGGGPLVADDGKTPIGGMMLIEAASRTEIEALVASDPYQRGGLFAEPQILAWNRIRSAPQAG